MIIRVYRCTVVKGMEAEFREFAYKTRHPWLRERPGLVAFYAGRALPGSDDCTRCMVQIWEGAEAIQAALGENWRQIRPCPRKRERSSNPPASSTTNWPTSSEPKNHLSR
jgi:hypothetical protein